VAAIAMAVRGQADLLAFFCLIFFGCHRWVYPRCKRTSAIFVFVDRPKRIESDRFGHKNGSARWRCRKSISTRPPPGPPNAFWGRRRLKSLPLAPPN
jgi:hypothetical protein